MKINFIFLVALLFHSLGFAMDPPLIPDDWEENLPLLIQKADEGILEKQLELANLGFDCNNDDIGLELRNNVYNALMQKLDSKKPTSFSTGVIHWARYFKLNSEIRSKPKDTTKELRRKWDV